MLMYAIAFAVASVMHILIFGEPFNELTLAGALGTATGIMLLPILVIAPWCLVQRRNKPTNKPIKVGTAVFVVMLTVGTYSQIAVYNYKCAEGMIAC